MLFSLKLGGDGLGVSFILLLAFTGRSKEHLLDTGPQPHVCTRGTSTMQSQQDL